MFVKTGMNYGSHVGLLEPDAQHAEETHVSHTDDQVQEGGSQDGFSYEDFAHPNSDLAGNSISRGDKHILPEECLDSESSKKQKPSEFSENFDCDEEPNQFQFYHLPSDSPPKWPISEHIDQYFIKYFSFPVEITRPTMKPKRTLVSPMVHSLKLLKSMLLLQILSRCLPIKAYKKRMISSRKSKITLCQVLLSCLSFGRHYRMVNPCPRRIYLVVFKET